MRGLHSSDGEEIRGTTTINSMKEKFKQNFRELKESAKQFSKQTGVVQTIPQKFMNLKDSLILWLTDLHEKSSSADERKLLTFLLDKIDRVFQLNDMFFSYWIQKNPNPNHLEKEFNEGIALLEAGTHSEVNTNIIKAVKDLAPDLEWYFKKAPCLEEHGTEREYANANIIGEKGVIYDDNLTVGLTVMPRRVQYPEHQHKAEEFYLVLNDGQWNKNSGEWQHKTLGEYVYNESNIVHSTRSGENPLVTLWFHYNPNDIQNFAYKFKDLPNMLKQKIEDKIESIRTDDADK